MSSERNYEADGVLVGSRSSGGVNTLQVVDHSGSPVLQVDYKTQAVSKRRFDPFGGVRQSASWSNGREYVNRVKDASVGTTHLLAREYDPGLGRFVSTDPVMDPADPQQLNPYAYANNSPVSKTDPDGLYATACDSCMTGPRSYRQVDRRGQWGLTYWSKSDARGRYGSRPAYYPNPRLVNYRGPNGGTNVVGGLVGSLAAALDAPAPGAWAVKKALGLPDDVAQQKADEFTGADRDDGKYKTAYLVGLLAQLLLPGGQAASAGKGSGILANLFTRGTRSAPGKGMLAETLARAKVKGEAGAARLPGRSDLSFARKVKLAPDNPAVINRGMPVQDFVAQFRNAKILRELPGEYLEMSVGDALRAGNSTVRKLLTDGRWSR